MSSFPTAPEGSEVPTGDQAFADAGSTVPNDSAAAAPRRKINGGRDARRQKMPSLPAAKIKRPKAKKTAAAVGTMKVAGARDRLKKKVRSLSAPKKIAGGRDRQRRKAVSLPKAKAGAKRSAVSSKVAGARDRQRRKKA